MHIRLRRDEQASGVLICHADSGNKGGETVGVLRLHIAAKLEELLHLGHAVKLRDRGMVDEGRLALEGCRVEPLTQQS